MAKNNVNAVLVRLSISIFPNARQDREITDEVRIKKALGQGAGKWTKYKLPDDCLEPIRKFCGIVRKFHYNHTCIWEDGQSLLSASARPNYDAKMNEFQDEFWKLVDAFGEEYPSWVLQAQIMHAATFDPADYPDWKTVRGMFRFGTEYLPMPKAEHFNKDMQKLYGEGLNALVESKITAANAEAWERLMEPVQKMAESLANPKTIFRDTLVENIKEMTALVPALNITGDAKLAEAAKIIEAQLTALEPQTLRESPVDRKEAAEKAQSILARFGKIGNRKLAA